jgi:hypothetical protein
MMVQEKRVQPFTLADLEELQVTANYTLIGSIF